MPEADGGGLRYNADKLPLELLPPEWIQWLGELMQMGAKKYDKHNWTRGMVFSNVEGCLARHFLAWRKGEDMDPESGLPHMVHVAQSNEHSTGEHH
jgi:hypothetical protein